MTSQPLAASPPIKYTSSCREDQRLSTAGKIVLKYCNVPKTSTFVHPPPPPPCTTVGVWLYVYVRGLISRNIIKKKNKQTNRPRERHYWSLHKRYHYCIFLRHQFWANDVSSGLIAVTDRGLRWLDTVFQSQYLPSLSINYVAINKDCEKLPYTTVVSDKDENLLWLTLQWHRSCRSNEMTLLPIFLGTGNCSSKIVYGSFFFQ